MVEASQSFFSTRFLGYYAYSFYLAGGTIVLAGEQENLINQCSGIENPIIKR